MIKRMLLVTLLVALLAAPTAVAQAPAPQQAAFEFISGLPNDFLSVTPAALKTRLDAGEKPFILDVREPGETATGYIQGAVLVPVREFPKNLDKLPADKNAEIIVICGSGLRSAYVVMALNFMGYTNAKNLVLGMREWNAQKFPVVK
jgi:adenylyltransferase/sulfurtransferase